MWRNAEQMVREIYASVRMVGGKQATLPKVERKEVNYFQPEQVAAIII